MSITDMQAAVIEFQKQLVEKQAQAGSSTPPTEAQVNEMWPNADEAWIIENWDKVQPMLQDIGEGAAGLVSGVLDAVSEFLNKLG